MGACPSKREPKGIKLVLESNWGTTGKVIGILGIAKLYGTSNGATHYNGTNLNQHNSAKELTHSANQFQCKSLDSHICLIGL